MARLPPARRGAFAAAAMLLVVTLLASTTSGALAAQCPTGLQACGDAGCFDGRNIVCIQGACAAAPESAIGTLQLEAGRVAGEGAGGGGAAAGAAGGRGERRVVCLIESAVFL